jgi:penicillin-binding protein 2
MAFLGQEEQIRDYQDRFRFLYAILFIALGILLLRLVYLQILSGERMKRYSEENRIKRVKIAAPRGMIFDRNRKLLIDNRPAFDLEIIPQYLKESRRTNEVITMISKIIKEPESEIRETLERNRTQAPFLPVKIKTGLSRDEVARIETWKIDMPGVEVRQEIMRTNLYGDIAAHLLGYIGEVNQAELPNLNQKSQKYKLGDYIGKFGLEQIMEGNLRGTDGEEIMEVDALGRVKLKKDRDRYLSNVLGKPATPGKNLILTIDQDIQEVAVKAMDDKIGSVVALDPRTGEVIAMLSRPAFDPTEFSRGVSPTLWNKLLKNENHPLRDKTIQDHYSPGSTFKVLTAITGLEEGVIDANTTFFCGGSIKVGKRTKHCHLQRGHGNVNVTKAISQSCDVFFYRVAQKLKSVDDIAKWARKLGLGKRSGINLPREVPGLVPTEAWRQERFNQPWNPGETLDVAIGQGFVLVTGLQLANMFAAVGNGGSFFKPYIVKEIESYEGQVLKEFQPEFLNKVELKPKTVELIKKGIYDVVNDPHGTAFGKRLPGMNFAGKTGTVQVIQISKEKIYSNCENLRFKDRHHGIFVGMAPVENPSIVVAVIAEHACSGSGKAAPVAREIVKAYLEKYFPDVYGAKILAAKLKQEGKMISIPKPAVSQEHEDVIVSEPDELPLPATAPVEKPIEEQQ